MLPKKKIVSSPPNGKLNSEHIKNDMKNMFAAVIVI